MKKVIFTVLLAIGLSGCAFTVRPDYYAMPSYVYYGPTYVGPTGIVVWHFGDRGWGYYRRHR